MGKVAMSIFVASVVGMGTGILSTCKLSTYIQFSSWAGVLLVMGLWSLDRTASIRWPVIASTVYSTLYITTHGLFETIVLKAHETVIGWVLMVGVFNGLSILTSCLVFQIHAISKSIWKRIMNEDWDLNRGAR